MRAQKYALILLLAFPVSLFAQREYFKDGLFRSRNATALLRIPALPSGLQAGEPRDSGNIRMLPFMWTADKTLRSSIILFFPPRQTGAAEPAAYAKEAAASLIQAEPALKPVAGGGALQLPGGKGHLLTLATGSAADSELVDLAVIADQGCVVILIARGRTYELKTILRPAAQKIAGAILVGSRVPSLPDRKTVPIAGVFEGPYKVVGRGGNVAWLVFDRRGYVHEQAPAGEPELDMDLLALLQPKNLGTYVQVGSAIEIKYPGSSSSRRAFQQSGRMLTIGGDEYHRVDGISNGMKLSGHYNSSSSITNTVNNQTFSYASSSDYYFTKEGTFSRESFAGANTVTTHIPTGNVTGNVITTAAALPKNGRYEIKDDQLMLTFTNGIKQTMTFFPNIERGKMDPGLIFLSGRIYSLE